MSKKSSLELKQIAKGYILAASNAEKTRNFI